MIAWHKPCGVVSTMRDPMVVMISRCSTAGVSRALPPSGSFGRGNNGSPVFSPRVSGASPSKESSKASIRSAGRRSTHNRTHPTSRKGVETSLGTFKADESVDGDLVRWGYEKASNGSSHPGQQRTPRRSPHRISYGAFELGDLDEGSTRPAHPDELSWLESRGAPLI